MTEIIRPISPSVTDKTGSKTYDPSELNPELAMIAMQREYGNKWPTPTVISKKYAVFDGIWKALNHDENTNKSYFDCRPRITLYKNVGYQSVNIDGKLFNALFTMWNKPKVVMQGISQLQSGFEEDKPGLLSRLWGGITGKGNNQEGKQ